MARLFLCVYHLKRGRKTALGWVNMNIFDYQRNMRRKQTLHMWDMEQSPSHHLLNPLKTTDPNFTFQVINYSFFSSSRINLYG